MEGECVPCEQNQIPSPDARSCNMIECKPREKMLQNGRCELCPKYQTPSEDLKFCVDPLCQPTEEVREDGTCFRSCPEYTKATRNAQNECYSDGCSSTQKLLKDGTCEECYVTMVQSSEDPKLCVLDKNKVFGVVDRD